MPTIGAYVNNSDYEKYKAIASANNLTVSEMIKQTFDAAKIVDVKKIKSLEIQKLKELNRVGNNLNQLSKYCNTYKKIDSFVLQSLINIETDIKKIF